jgi:hypothetical protein
VHDNGRYRQDMMFLFQTPRYLIARYPDRHLPSLETSIDDGKKASETIRDTIQDLFPDAKVGSYGIADVCEFRRGNGWINAADRSLAAYKHKTLHDFAATLQGLLTFADIVIGTGHEPNP